MVVLEVTVGEAISYLVMAMGIPSSITGLAVWYFKKQIAFREEHDKEQAKLALLLVQSSRAAISLAEATAHAMQRGHTNGDMEEALEYAHSVKKKKKEFLEEKGIKSILE